MLYLDLSILLSFTFANLIILFSFVHILNSQVAEIRTVLKQEMKLKVLEIEDPGAIVNGGDVFFTGMIRA